MPYAAAPLKIRCDATIRLWIAARQIGDGAAAGQRGQEDDSARCPESAFSHSFLHPVIVVMKVLYGIAAWRWSRCEKRFWNRSVREERSLRKSSACEKTTVSRGALV